MVKKYFIETKFLQKVDRWSEKVFKIKFTKETAN